MIRQATQMPARLQTRTGKALGCLISSLVLLPVVIVIIVLFEVGAITSNIFANLPTFGQRDDEQVFSSRSTERAPVSLPSFTPARATATALSAETPIPTGYVYFPETRHSVTLFAQPFNERGGVTSLGFPITEVFREKGETDGEWRWVQYFEKALFEYHPNLGGSNRYQLAALGAQRFRARYPSGSVPNDLPPRVESLFFPETGYSAYGPFLMKWHQLGGLARSGYPISNTFGEKSALDDRTFLVQYFERVTLEYHPELPPPHQIQLTPLGTLQLMEMYPNGAPDNADKPVER